MFHNDGIESFQIYNFIFIFTKPSVVSFTALRHFSIFNISAFQHIQWHPKQVLDKSSNVFVYWGQCT